MPPTPATGESCEVISKSEGLKAFFFPRLKSPHAHLLNASLPCVIKSIISQVVYFGLRVKPCPNV